MAKKLIPPISSDKIKSVDSLLGIAQPIRETTPSAHPEHKEETSNDVSSKSEIKDEPASEPKTTTEIENTREEKKQILRNAGKKKAIVPNLDEIINTNKNYFSSSVAANIHITQEHLNKINLLTFISDKKNYNRSILANIIDMFFDLYKDDIDVLKKEKMNF